MSLECKSDDNLSIARYCLQENRAICVGVSRAYYSAFQRAKAFLILNGVNDKNYGTKAVQWKCNIKQPQNAFAHDSIWDVLKAYMRESKHPGQGLKISGIGKRLHSQRKEADYEDRDFDQETLNSCILSAESLIRTIKGE